jgi:hypothetical protein
MIDRLHALLSAAGEKTGRVTSVTANVFFKHVNAICEKTGLPKVGIHGLRHSFVSLAYHLGMAEKITMEIGGWSDYATMRKIYTHISRKDVNEHVEKMSRFFQTLTKTLMKLIQPHEHRIYTACFAGSSPSWRANYQMRTRLARSPPGRRSFLYLN